MWWAYTRVGLYSGGGAYSRRFAVYFKNIPEFRKTDYSFLDSVD